MFDLLRERHGFLENVSAYASRGANVLGDGWSERLQVGAITGDFLPLTGVRPSLGRGFLAAEFQPGHNAVALLTQSLWQRRFGGAPDAIGRTINIDDAPYTIVGVLPADFRSIDELETGAPTWEDDGLGVLVPLAVDPKLRSGDSSSSTTTVRILGRLRQPRMLEAARDEVRFLGRRFSGPSGPVTPSYTLTPMVAALSEGVPERMALLAAAVAVLLLVACANAALLMLERGESRRRELEIRAALGATAARLAGEGLVEASLLGASAGVIGVAVAWGAVGVMRTAGGAALSGLASTRVSWPVVGFALAVSLGTALLAGLLPSVKLLRTDVARWLPSQGPPRPPSLPGSLPSSTVVAQVGLSVGLIVVGGMLARDFSRLAAVDVGYQTKGVLSAEVAVSPVRHPDGGRQFLGSLLERVRSLPGVQAAALVHPVPGGPSVGALAARVEGFGDETLQFRIASASFFSLLRVPILAGRSFTDAEVEHSEPVVVVTNAFAERYWGSARAALGRHIAIGRNSAGTPSGWQLTIVGVARDFRDTWMRYPPARRV